MWKFVVFAALFAIASAEQKIPVDVYYETLCPDSIAFLTKQLVPAYNSQLKNYMNLNLVPFGKATVESNNGNYNFKCHHGPVECYGNKVQGCILKQLSQQDDQMKYINCLLNQAKTLKNEYPLNKCIDEGDLNTVVGCANATYAGARGSRILAEYGEETNRLNPPLTSVPTVVFNRMYNKTEQDLAQKDFKQVLCSYIKSECPKECNAASSITVSSLVAVLSFAVLRYL